MKTAEIINCLENFPVIAAADSESFDNAVKSGCEIIFHINADLNILPKQIKEAEKSGKKVFVHIDLSEGIGKDKSGILWLKNIGAKGIISTRSQLIKYAKETGLLAVQRFFILDSKGIHSIKETLSAFKPDMIEIMPGVIPKAISDFKNTGIPVIAGGLVETDKEVITALNSGAVAVSTGKSELWNE